MVPLYEKVVEASWYDPHLKRTKDVSVLTYEPTQKPSREKELTMELLKAYSGAGDFEYGDDCVVAEEENQPLYPEIEIAIWYFTKIDEL